VEILWTARANPVDNRTPQNILVADLAGSPRVGNVDGAFAIRFA
jgi:hypothetical protein